jgi:hypothetical protein
MADGFRVDPRDDGAEQAALASEARLVRRVRWRLVAWSGVSTLVVLVGLAIALYAAVANTLAAASTQQLSNRVDPWVAALEGTNDAPVQPPGFGFQPGRGNTYLFAFDADGTPVRLGREPVAVLGGLPDTAAIAAANVAPDGTDVRTTSLEIATSRC